MVSLMREAEEKYKEIYPDFKARCADADARYRKLYAQFRDGCDAELV